MAEPATALARQPGTAHAAYVVLTVREALALELALAGAAGDAYLTGPNRSFALHLLAEELHRRILGGPPQLGPEVLAKALAAQAADGTPAAGPGQAEEGPPCGERRTDGATCVEMAGHGRSGYPHMWAAAGRPAEDGQAATSLDGVLSGLAAEDKHGSLDVAEWAELQRQRRVARLGDEDGQ